MDAEGGDAVWGGGKEWGGAGGGGRRVKQSPGNVRETARKCVKCRQIACGWGIYTYGCAYTQIYLHTYIPT